MTEYDRKVLEAENAELERQLRLRRAESVMNGLKPTFLESLKSLGVPYILNTPYDTLLTAQSPTPVELRVDSDCDFWTDRFLCHLLNGTTKVVEDPLGVNVLDVTIRINAPFNQIAIIDGRCAVKHFHSSARHPHMLGKAIYLPRGSSMELAFMNNSAAGTNFFVNFCLVGVLIQ